MRTTQVYNEIKNAYKIDALCQKKYFQFKIMIKPFCEQKIKIFILFVLSFKPFYCTVYHYADSRGSQH